MKLSLKIKKQIDLYRKNKLDISELIDGYNLKGENLSGNIIKRLNRFNEDLEGINLSNCEIKELNLVRCNLKNSNFKEVVVSNKSAIRYSDCRGATFANAFLPFLEYQHADLRNTNLCDCVIRVGSRGGHHAKIDDEILIKWGIKITKGEINGHSKA